MRRTSVTLTRRVPLTSFVTYMCAGHVYTKIRPVISLGDLEMVTRSYRGTCCKGTACQYGQCIKGAKQGEPGTYCDKSSECDETSCCVREISVNPRTSLCKPMLDEYESCGPINLFHQVYNDGKVEPACGPCKPKLQCKNVGTRGLHLVCLKEEED